MDSVDKFVEEGLKKIDEEENNAKTIRNMAAHICGQLKPKKSMKIKIEGVEYQIGIVREKSEMVLRVINVTRFNLGDRKIKKYNGQISEEYDAKQVTETLIATFLADVTQNLIFETDMNGV